MKKVMFVFLTLTVIGLFLIFSSCAKDEPSGAQEVSGGKTETAKETQETAAVDSIDGKGLVIGISVQGTDHHWNINCYNGAIDRAKELGAEVIAFDAEHRQEKHLSDVRTLISRDVDAIGIILGMADSLSPGVKEAVEKGIPIVTADFSIPESLCNVASNNFTAMAELVLKMVSDLKGKGEVAVFYRPGTPVGTLRRRVFDTVLASYPSIKVVAEEAYIFPGTVPDAYNKAQDMLRAKPEIDAFWTVFDMPMIAAAQAIADLGRQSEVKCYGFDGDPTAMKMLMDKTSAYGATVAQQPYAIGQALAEVAIMAAKGQELPTLRFVPHILVDKNNVEEVWNMLPQYEEARGK